MRLSWAKPQAGPPPRPTCVSPDQDVVEVRFGLYRGHCASCGADSAHVGEDAAWAWTAGHECGGGGST